jgi:diaminopimelate decarboxylase
MKSSSKLNWKFLESLSTEYGDSFYLLDLKRFVSNFHEFLGAFRQFYPKTFIGYSYKTNYTPAICRQAHELGAYAEVVSGMEFDLARSLGIPTDRIIFNGPYKKRDTMEQVVLGKGMLHLDSLREVAVLEEIARSNPESELKVGVRCNFDIGEALESRFGFDVDSDSFREVRRRIERLSNVKVNGLHCHFPNRNLESFISRTERMLELSRAAFSDRPDYINIGGGFFGKMSDFLKRQFSCHVPSYQEYASEIGSRIAAFFSGAPPEEQPMLILEPGTALVADALRYLARVVSVKKVGTRNIATIAGSAFNIKPTSQDRNLPMTLIKCRSDAPAADSERFDICGYTCIETDYLFKGFAGAVEEGDFALFENVGSYSVVMKPPFILPNVAMLAIDTADMTVKVVKRPETVEDVFRTFVR